MGELLVMGAAKDFVLGDQPSGWISLKPKTQRRERRDTLERLAKATSTADGARPLGVPFATAVAPSPRDHVLIGENPGDRGASA